MLSLKFSAFLLAAALVLCINQVKGFMKPIQSVCSSTRNINCERSIMSLLASKNKNERAPQREAPILTPATSSAPEKKYLIALGVFVFAAL